MNAPLPMHPESYSPKDFKSDLKPIWCPGCGDFGVLQAIYRSLAAIGRARAGQEDTGAWVPAAGVQALRVQRVRP